MQPLALWALTCGVIVTMGVSVTLVLTRRAIRPHPLGANRWQSHASIPLGAAGLVLGVISRNPGQSAATHDVIVATAGALVLGALACAAAGGITAMRYQRAAR
jgi:hypothetical protein